MQRPLFILAWFFGSIGLILSSVAGFHLTYGLATPQPIAENTELLTPVAIAAATSQTETPTAVGSVKGVSTIIEFDDSRPTIVANFLERYNSPLTPYDEYGEKLVAIADKYNIDFRLLPAIAMQESNLCKVIPPDSYNCLGFGVHSRGTLGFDNYEAGFERAAKELKANYIDRGLTTPEEIMSKYTPSSNGSWAASVNQWMAEMRYDDRKLGKELKTDANVLEFVASEAADTASTSN
jgi:hypothetical protein